MIEIAAGSVTAVHNRSIGVKTIYQSVVISYHADITGVSKEGKMWGTRIKQIIAERKFIMLYPSASSKVAAISVCDPTVVCSPCIAKAPPVITRGMR